MRECTNLPKCGFFLKYDGEKKLPCQGFINLYCKGEKQGECKRKIFMEENGYPPSDDMLPSGVLIK